MIVAREKVRMIIFLMLATASAAVAALAAAETILEKSQDQLKQIHPGFAPKQPSSSSAPPLVMELSGPDGDKTPVKITSAEEMAERIDKMKMLGMS